MQNVRNDKELAPGTVLFRIFSGILFGFANVIPGVSGGTMMVVLGMYERIIGIITDLKHKLRSEWKFYIPVGLGMLIAIILFGKLMSALLDEHKEVMQMFFIGVIIFSIPGIFKKAAADKKRTARKEITCVLCFALMLAVMVFMAYSPANEEKEAIKAGKETAVTAEITEETEEKTALTQEAEIPEGTEAEPVSEEENETEKKDYSPDHSAGHLLLLVIIGAIACSTMIIPGISGSLVMVMLGQYEAIMAAIANFDWIYLFPFAAGCLLGLIFCAKLIKYLLKNHERATYSAILGFVLGSVLPVFPGWSNALCLSGIIAFVIGGACIIGCDLLSKKIA